MVVGWVEFRRVVGLVVGLQCVIRVLWMYRTVEKCVKVRQM